MHTYTQNQLPISLAANRICSRWNRCPSIRLVLIDWIDLSHAGKREENQHRKCIHLTWNRTRKRKSFCQVSKKPNIKRNHFHNNFSTGNFLRWHLKRIFFCFLLVVLLYRVQLSSKNDWAESAKLIRPKIGSFSSNSKKNIRSVERKSEKEDEMKAKLWNYKLSVGTKFILLQTMVILHNVYGALASFGTCVCVCKLCNEKCRKFAFGTTTPVKIKSEKLFRFSSKNVQLKCLSALLTQTFLLLCVVFVIFVAGKIQK